MSRSTARATVDLPQPDSPTRPRDVPLGTLKETSLTARTILASGPPRFAKCLERLRTTRCPLLPRDFAISAFLRSVARNIALSAPDRRKREVPAAVHCNSAV